MPPEHHSHADPSQWLVRARSNLLLARATQPGVLVLKDDLCFEAQQAAEKATQAVLLKAGVRFPFTHDVGRLLDLARENQVPVPDEVDRADVLTRFAVLTRYPGGEAVTEAEYVEAVKLAEHVVEWAAQLVSGEGGVDSDPSHS